MRVRTPLGLAAPSLLALLACAPGATPPPEQPAATLAVAGAHGLPFLENDWPGALSAARERKLPLFIEAWAPW